MATQIGAQMYTIREHCKTPADIARSCERLKKIGYGAVQVSAIGPIEPKELAKILKDNGLVCAATHQSLDQMKNVDACAEYHQTIGCKYTAIGGFFPKTTPTTQDWLNFAKDFNGVAAALDARGVKVGYHNHSHEFAHYDGRRALDHLVQHLDARVWFELDTYWVAHGGGDPAAWIEKVKGRIPCVHFKDIVVTHDRQHKMCEVGSGNLNWPRILQACKAAGVEWYLVERDSGDLDPFESLKISLENMRAMGLQ